MNYICNKKKQSLKKMIKVTSDARIKVSQLMQEEGFNPDVDYIRVGVKSGGCSGLSYDLTFAFQELDPITNEDYSFDGNKDEFIGF